MRPIYTALAVFFSATASAQMNDSLLHYYEYVNKAEMQIVDSNYQQAIALYETGFSFKKHPFGRDMYNHAVCAVLTKEYSKVHSDLKHLIAKGYPLDSLQARSTFNDFFLSKNGKELVKYAKDYLPQDNVGLREMYDSMFVLDQFYRKKHGSYAVYGDTIEKIDNANVDLVRALIDEHGFPSQNLIGVYPSFDYKAFGIMVIHNQFGNRFGQYFNYTEILYNGIYSGILDVRTAIQLLSGSTGNGDLYGFEFMGLVRHGIEGDTTLALTPWGFYSLKDEKMKLEIDSKRADVGLCGLLDARVKIVLGLREKRFFLTDAAGKKTNLWSNKKDYQNAVEYTVILE
ncbi:MAG: hypothetical protein JKX84_08110 [Flavobacteriales bacterium]|nr:hypothetical protein [Flavobacteriales bacterium]